MKPRAFTLIELIVGMGITLIIFGIGGVALSNLLNDTQLSSDSRDLLQTLRTAHANSISGYQNSAWGVQLNEETGVYTLFAGNTFATRATEFDRVAQLGGTLSFQNITIAGGGHEIIFLKGTGLTTHTGTFEILDTTQYTRFTSNAAGHVSLELLSL
ncbi:hypothetical protein COV82_04095 [Candidatus Peregrinibacteria bacterium CG11_big_fil_rev_8_21_14_0_20_46_8]|nr:MAG: hypothetical protein COV82_04095 [Candidatus Peregrinibacteria bacterium CG11_big_fil_rev_8_21_14_0_20_46_8]